MLRVGFQMVASRAFVSSTKVNITAMSEITQPKRSQKVRESELSLRKVSESLQQLSPNAVRTLREIYSMIDSDGTGSVSKQELQRVFASVGIHCEEATIDEMLQKTGDPVSCAAFLAVMADHIGRLESRDNMEGILEAFTRDGSAVDVAEIKSSLRQEGLDDKEIDAFISGFFKRSVHGQEFDRKTFIDTLSL